MSNQKSKYAGFWKRFSAFVLDGVIVLFFSATLKWVIAEMLRSQADYGYDPASSHMQAYYIWSVYVFIVRWCYFAGMESSPLKATIGKFAVGIYVVDHNEDQIEFGKASGRFFGKILSGIILGIGYIMAGITPQKQALHDKLTRCYVLNR